MSKVLLDQYQGRTEYLHDLGDNKFAIEFTADIEPVLNQVARMRQVSDGKSKSKELYHVARIPKDLIDTLSVRMGVDLMAKENSKLFDQVIDSPEFSRFRIYQGKL
jgi:hypothetical protein